MNVEHEYKSHSEAVSDLIRKSREVEAMRARLIEAEQSEFTAMTRKEIRAEIRESCGAMASYRINEDAKRMRHVSSH